MILLTRSQDLGGCRLAVSCGFLGGWWRLARLRWDGELRDQELARSRQDLALVVDLPGGLLDILNGVLVRRCDSERVGFSAGK